MVLPSACSSTFRRNAPSASSILPTVRQPSRFWCFALPRKPLSPHTPADTIQTSTEDELKNKQAEAEAKRELEGGPDGPLNKFFNEKFNRKMEAMKQMNRKDMNILLFQKESPTNKQVQTRPGTGRHREQIDTNEGFILFNTGRLDTPVEVCVQIYSAKQEKPALVALNATVQPLQVTEKDLETQHVMLQGHTSRISSDLRGIQGRLNEIITQADASKKRERDMHDQIVALHTAAGRWPMLRVVIVVIAGYLQITRVVQYMKSRHAI